jgi:hypothetical protein
MSMSTTPTTMQSHADNYLNERRQLGFGLRSIDYAIKSFARGLSRCPREPHMMYSGVAAGHLRRARGGAQWQGHDL